MGQHGFLCLSEGAQSMDHIIEQKCSACGAALRFDPELGKLICDHCGNSVEIPEEVEVKVEDVSVQGLDFSSLNEQAMDIGAADLPIYNCVSCGAEVIAPAEQIATTCPYCGNNIVLTDKVSGKLRPDGILPFLIDKKRLPDRMKDYYKGKALLPKNFFSESTMGKVTGVYVPFWIFNGRLTGTLRYHATTSRTYRHGDYDVTLHNHYETDRNVDVSFENLPVDASGRISDELMDSLEPFRMSESKPFHMSYLAGFTADRFDQAKDDVAGRAERRMAKSAESAAYSTVASEYGSVTRMGGTLKAELNAKYMLLPVYLFSITHNGTAYDFAVNGQTGQVVGNIPTDKAVSRAYFLKRAAAVAAGTVAAFFIKYLLGG